MSDRDGLDMARWLEGLGLAQYVRAFLDNAVGFDSLARLSNDDWRELGVLLGHRQLLLDALQASPPSPAEAERRQLTVMFCDMVGSTALASRLDPEDLRDLIRLYQSTCRDIIHRYDAFIARYLGDGILVYFGYPRAHEDAAARAVLAGLEIVDALRAVTAPGGEPVRVRIGVATGLGVVGDRVGQGASEEVVVTGQVAHLAARLLAVAEPGTVLAADATRRLLPPRFDCQDAGVHTLKGIDGEVQAWRVLRERPAVDVTPGGLAVVGRDREITRLAARLEQARAGQGQVVLVSGEAGIGKSCLLGVLAASLGDARRLTVQCSARHRDSPLHPLIAHLQAALGWQPDVPAAQRLDAIERLFGTDAAPLAAALLSVPTGGRYPAAALTADQQRDATLALLAAHPLRLAEAVPLLLCVEDAHWIDPSTADWLDRLVEQLPGHRVLVVVTARPGYRPAWIDRPQASGLPLSRLAPADAQVLIRRVAGGKALPPVVAEQILAKADGVPLFAEEVTRSVLESGQLSEQGDAWVLDGALRALAIPSTLQDSLMARLDRLGPAAKDLAQVGAAIGRRFSPAMLQAVTGLDATAVAGGLQTLVDAGLVFERRLPGGALHAFKHALVQDVAYDTLLRARRRTLHGAIAQALEARFADVVLTEPETLAHHWERADEPERAARYWLQAGQRAAARSSGAEALQHLNHGIDALGRVPEGPGRGRLAFDLHLALGQTLYVVRGPAAIETTRAYATAQELVEEVGESDQRYALLYGIFSTYHFAARFDLAEGPARRVLALATRERDAGHVCQGHRMLGYIRFFKGDTRAALHHFAELARAYDPDWHRRLAFRYGADCLVAARGFQAVIESMSAAPERALQTVADNLAHAHALGHAATIGWAYASSAYVRYHLDEPAATHRVAAEGVRFCTASNVAAWAVHCRLFEAWAASHDGAPGTRAPDMRRDLLAAAAGNSLGLPLLRGLLADVLRRAGDAPAALHEADAAVAEVSATGQRVFEPLLLVVRADALAAQGLATEAADCLHRSMALAAHEGGSLVELRAAQRLAALAPQDDGGALAARIAGLRALFRPGLDLPDLRGAPDTAVTSSRAAGERSASRGRRSRRSRPGPGPSSAC